MRVVRDCDFGAARRTADGGPLDYSVGLSAGTRVLRKHTNLRHGKRMEAFLCEGLQTVDTVYYGGVIYPHFGHFVLESLSRIAAVPPLPSDRWVFHSLQNEWLEWQLEILDFLGVLPDNLSLVGAHGYHADRAMFPRQLASAPYSLGRRQIAALARSNHRTSGSEKLFLRREATTASNSRRGTSAEIFESTIEERARAQQFTIMSPLDLPFNELVGRVAEASVIRSSLGSNLYNLAFVEGAGKTVQIEGYGSFAKRKAPFFISWLKKAGYRVSFRLRS